MSVVKIIIDGVEQNVDYEKLDNRPPLIKGSGDYSIVQYMGENPASANTASAAGAIALGSKSEATGICSLAIGTKLTNGGVTKATGGNALAFGAGVVSGGQASQAFGIGTEATGRASLVCGQFNVKDTNAEDSSHGTGARKYVFTVGNGTADNARSNALAVDWSGNVEVGGTLKIGSTTITEAQLISLLATL